MIATLSAVLLISGLGGVILGVTWAVMALADSEDSPRRALTPAGAGALLITSAWLIPTGGSLGEPPEPTRAEPSPIAADALLQPTPMIATHTRRAYALSAAGKISIWGEPIPDPLAADGTVARVAVGREHLCVLRPTGALSCWGEQREGQASPPGGTFVALSAGTEHSCALTEDGEPWCWGRRDDRLMPPEGLRLVSLSSSDRHTCGLDAQGQIHCWGCRSQDRAACDAPPGQYRQVSAGHQHSCALDTQGQVRCWGSNEAGQAQPPAGRFSHISAGWSQTCALDNQGQIRCWGCQGRAQALDPTQASHCQAPPGRFIALTSGDIWGSCAIEAAEGSTRCWGGPAREGEQR